MLVFQMRNVDKTSTVLKQTKNSDYADISTITATPLHSGTTGATCRRNTG